MLWEKDPPRICCATFEAGRPGCWSAAIITNEIEKGDAVSVLDALNSAKEKRTLCQRPELLETAMANARKFLG